MLILEGDARNGRIDRRLACTLALVAGALNSAGFYAVGFFSANMTGNVSILADHVALGDLLRGLFYLAIVATFVVGALVSTLLISVGRRRSMAGIYAVSIVAEAVLLTGLGCADLLLPDGERGPILIFGLSFLMGLQNAVVTRISNARVRTTHISGMATDIGIELGTLVDHAWRRGPPEEAMPVLEKLRLHAATVLSFCLGGVGGVVAYKAFGSGLLFGAAAVLFAVALPGLMKLWGRGSGGPAGRSTYDPRVVEP
ncbi:YoaK family protein [Lichenihabitans psoromatis]|uniref:YoaK family protein n=1 Tax=Lichenihabitans psoromatis TaxID=2528642 RepID=UPI0010359543|nr:YoaK family protein [Lichenihabitans psoromatis]